MNNPNYFKSKFFSVALGISMVLCSLSLLVFSISQTPLAKAEASFVPPSSSAPWDNELRGAVGLGIAKDSAYFVVWGNPNVFYKVSLKAARDWYKD